MHFSKWNEKLSFTCSSLLPAAAQRLKQMISPFQAGFVRRVGWPLEDTPTPEVGPRGEWGGVR